MIGQRGGRGGFAYKQLRRLAGRQGRTFPADVAVTACRGRENWGPFSGSRAPAGRSIPSHDV